MVKRVLAIAIPLLATAAIVGHGLWPNRFHPAEAAAPAGAGPTPAMPEFREAPVDFRHVHAGPPTLPLAGAAMIDTDGDGRDEIFVAGGANQGDGLLAWRAGRFVNVIADSGLSDPAAAYGALSLDLDDDRDVDLVVARHDGLKLYRNDGYGRFAAEAVAPAAMQDIVPMAITAGDVNRDGKADLFITGIAAGPQADAARIDDPNRETQGFLLLGDAEGRFRDGTAAAGLGGRQDARQAMLADLDNDGWQDLAIAQRHGRVLIFRNRGDGTFLLAATPATVGHWLAMAAGDYDGDGDMDLFLSKGADAAASIPFLGRTRAADDAAPGGVLLRNDGRLRFAEVAAEAGLAGASLGASVAFADANLDGRPDLVAAVGRAGWPARLWNSAFAEILLQTTPGGFLARPQSEGGGSESPGPAVLSADFDADGHPDLIQVALDGPPRALMNRGGKARSVTVRFADHARSLGARVTVIRQDGVRLSGQVMAGAGFLSDPSPSMIFGLGTDDRPVDIEVVWPDRRKRSYRQVVPGRVLQVKRP